MKSLHNATVFQPKIENGYFTGYVYDLYDFKYLIYGYYGNIYKKQKFYAPLTIANNSAKALQDLNVIRKYNIVVPIKIKL